MLSNKPSTNSLSLFLTFLVVGAISFGGGVVAYLREYTVYKRKWLNDKDFLAALTLGQTLPGLVAINLSVIIGDRLGGIKGALLAVLGILLPGTIVVLSLGLGYLHYGDNHHVRAFLSGVAAAAIAFMLKVVLEIGAYQLTHTRNLLFVLITFTAVGILHIPLLMVLLVVVPFTTWLI